MYAHTYITDGHCQQLSRGPATTKATVNKYEGVVDFKQLRFEEDNRVGQLHSISSLINGLF